MHRAVHSLKRLIGNYATRNAFEKAATVDRLIRQSRLDEAEAAFHECLGVVEKLRTALAGFAESLAD